MLKITMNYKLITIALLGIMGCLGSMTSCSSRHITNPVESRPTLITLERTIHFRNVTGNATQVPPGTYTVSADQENLRLTREMTNNPLTLEAQTITHEERVKTTTPLSFSEEADEHVIMLLFPDGTALETVGSYSGIQSRASRKKRARVSRATIKRQLQRGARVNRARLANQTHFTLRVPVQLNNLSPDINQLKIRCWTHSGNDATKPDKRIGEGEAIANVTNRQYNGTVVVQFNANQGKEPEDADRYNCSMFFHKPGIGFRQPGKYGHPLANSKPAWLVSADGTPFKIHAQAGVN